MGITEPCKKRSTCSFVCGTFVCDQSLYVQDNRSKEPRTGVTLLYAPMFLYTQGAHTNGVPIYIHPWGYAVHHLGCTVQPRWRVRKNEGKRLNLPVWGSGILRKPECCTGIFTPVRLHTGPSMAERKKVTITFDHNLTHVMFSGYF